MRIYPVILLLAISALLTACEKQQPATAIDPQAGVDCFESLRASLPPGTQYEGIDRLDGERISIRIMNGVNVVTTGCPLNPDGSLQGAGAP